MKDLINTLTQIIEKHKTEYRKDFDNHKTDNVLRKNVILISQLLPKIAQELIDAKNDYILKNKDTDKSEIDEIKDNLYMEFVQFSTNFEG